MRSLGIILIIFVLLSCSRSSQESLLDQRDNNKYRYIETYDAKWMIDDLVYLDREIYNKNAWVWNSHETYPEIDKKRLHSDICVLYNWETACEYCPEGWHLPSEKEWMDLLSSVSDETTELGGLSTLNLSFDGHARIFEKFCIFDGNTYWTSDTSESKQIAISIAIQQSPRGGINYNSEASVKDNAFYVRCVKDKE